MVKAESTSPILLFSTANSSIPTLWHCSLIMVMKLLRKVGISLAAMAEKSKRKTGYVGSVQRGVPSSLLPAI